MRGNLTATTRSRAAAASTALISQRAGPLTASPAGEADAIAKKLIWRGCEPPSLPPRGKVAPQGRMRGSLTATTRSRAAAASTALISQRSGPLTASPKGEADAIAKKLIWRGCENPKPSPMGEGGPAGPDEGRACRGSPCTGHIGKPAPHQSAVGAADSFPQGGSRSTEKSAKTLLTRPCFYDKLSLVKKAATGSRPSAHLEGLQKPRVIP